MEFHGEGGIDRLLRTAFYPRSAYKGVLVEVGAADPFHLSIGKHFRDSGWKVISIEPNPYFAARHREAGHTIFEFACGESDKDAVEFEIVHPKIPGSIGAITYESFSSFKVKESYKNNDPNYFSNMDVETIRVNMRRLDTILKETDIKFIDVLTVDVEGYEIEVLSGLSFHIYGPNVLVVENWLNDANYGNIITQYGYKFVCRMFPNDIYIKNGAFSNTTYIIAKLYCGFINKVDRLKNLLTF